MRYAVVEAVTVPTDRARVRRDCAGGCPHYGRNWACPPFAPEFGDLARGPLLAMLVRLKPDGERWREGLAEDRSRDFFEEAAGRAAINLARSVAGSLGGLALGWGQCTACGESGCAAGKGLPCRDQRARIFSLEACGVKVEELVRQAFGQRLSWWPAQEREIAPAHCTRVVGVLACGALGEHRAAAAMEAAAAALAG